MGRPAARTGDMHLCPMVAPGPCPHIGGPVAAGSPNVITGGMPQARVGDKAICCCPPDTIAAGSSGVIVNGKAAARMGDSTAHGGKIILGCMTVLMGGGGGGGGQSASASGSSAIEGMEAGSEVGKTVVYGQKPVSTFAQSLQEAAGNGEPYAELSFCEVPDRLTTRASDGSATLITTKTDKELRELVALSRSDVDGIDIGRSFTNLPGSVRNFPGVQNNKNGTFNITDRDAFINQVDTLFKSDGNRLNPVIRDRIVNFIGNDASRVFPVKGRGLPGLHAEVQAVNAALNKAPIGTLPRNINVSTIDLLPGSNQGLAFPACNNCGGILQGFNILTGVK
ncbi:hypothetical protein MNBD_GAMMA11-2255 [hydrothermal vent metagenome]|uniref:Uncharacterized protein n=1 Tax=hydrothermal vent metagenome TaxID=652676 RepID=A0A3B0WUF5_9ZZZZ